MIGTNTTCVKTSGKVRTQGQCCQTDTLLRSLQYMLVRMQSKERQLNKLIESYTSNTPSKTNNNYSFKTAGADLISLSEIGADIDRNNPVAEVVLKGENYADFHYLLIHSSIRIKLNILDQEIHTNPSNEHNDIFITMLHVINTQLVAVTPTAYAYNLTQSEYEYSSIIRLLDFVFRASLKDFDQKECTVMVRYLYTDS